MINGLFGRPRSGKSYEAVRYHILEALKKGRMVVTNIPVNVDYIEVVYGEKAANLLVFVKTNYDDYGAQRPFSQPDHYTKYDWKNEEGQGPLFVVDEAHLCLGREAKKEVLEYLSLHGHYGHDILLLSQNPRKINRDVKDMVEISWRCVKTAIYGDDNGYIRKCYHGVSAQQSDFIDMVELEYDPAFFKFYKSHTQSSTAVDEAKAGVNMDRIKNKKLFIGMIAAGALLAVFTGKRMISVIDQPQPESVVESVEESSEPPVVEFIDDEPMPNRIKLSKSSNQASQVSKDETQTEQNIPVEEKEVLGPKKSINQLLYEARIAQSKTFHPYYRVNLHIRGSSLTGQYNSPTRRLSISASQNGQVVFSMTSSDLIAAGYQVEVYSDCSALIRYLEYEDFLTCDHPTAQVTTAQAE